MYAIDVYEKTREKYEQRIIKIAKENDVVKTEFDVEYDEVSKKKLFFYRAWCN